MRSLSKIRRHTEIPSGETATQMPPVEFSTNIRRVLLLFSGCSLHRSIQAAGKGKIRPPD